MISIKNLCKSFDRKNILRDYDLCVDCGKITFLMAPSGFGKTTLLRIILGLDKDYTGTVMSDERFSAVFQEDRLIEFLPADKNVLIANPKLIPDTARTALCVVGFTDDDCRKAAKDLSGGMARRAAIVRAAEAEYTYLIADEPFKGLDGDTKIKTMSYVRQKLEMKGGLIVTHDKTEADFFQGDVLKL